MSQDDNDALTKRYMRVSAQRDAALARVAELEASRRAEIERAAAYPDEYPGEWPVSACRAVDLATGRAEQAEAERDVLRGVDCGKDGRDFCGVCIRCAVRGTLAPGQRERWSDSISNGGGG